MTQVDANFQQIERIRSRLKLMAADGELLRLHGFSARKFSLAAPASEVWLSAIESREHTVIPAALRNFYLLLGNGGIGPHCGIFAIESCAFLGDVEACAGPRDCVLRPELSKYEWQELVRQHEENDAELYAGILVFSTLGCSFDVGVVLRGPWAGRIVHIDHEHEQMPYFCPYDSFLDWYEGWLDELQAGYDTRYFGLVPNGDESAVMQFCAAATDDALCRALQGFSKFRSWNADNSEFLLALRTHADELVRAEALRQLARLDFNAASAWLQDGLYASDKEMWVSLQVLATKSDQISERWALILQRLLHTTSSCSVMREAFGLLRPRHVDAPTLLLGFVNHVSAEVRAWAIGELGRSVAAGRFYPQYLQALHDDDQKVRSAALVALRGRIQAQLYPQLESMLDACEPDHDPEYTVKLIQRLAETGSMAHPLLERVRMRSKVGIVCEAAYVAVYQ